MAGKDSHLYGIQKHRRLAGDKEISSSSTLSFTSQLSSLINSSPGTTTKLPRHKPKKEDIFATHNRNTAKRAKRDLEDVPSFQQKHSTHGEALDSNTWARSRRKMEEKARLYAAMKRGDVEDADERYAVDFDRKWAESQGKEEDEEVDDDGSEDEGPQEQFEYLDEFGRTRTGTRAEAAAAERAKLAQKDGESDRFTARPSAPANVIYGDTIQHQAFDPDAPIAAQMEALAKKRDKSLTPPPESHFDANWEIRTKGTGFFQFSEDAEERKRQMEDLAKERAETERRRMERESKAEERRRQIEARRREIAERKGKRKADDFLEQLGEELAAGKRDGDGKDGDEMMERIEDAMRREEDG